MIWLVDCSACATANELAKHTFWQKAQCGRCGATLPASSLERLGRAAFPMRYSLGLALALSLAVLVALPFDLSSTAPPAEVPPSALPAAEGNHPVATVEEKQSAQAPSDEQALASLKQGVHEVLTTAPRVAPLRIGTPVGDEQYYVKIVDADTGATMLTLFVKAGQILRTKVPLGSARIKYATGRVWRGKAELFGPETRYNEADEVFEFTRDDRGVQGYTVELIKQIGGNLSTRSLSRAEF